MTFLDGVFDMIYKFSSGIPRLINLICDFLLLSAFVEETKQLDLELVKDAVNELSFEEPHLQSVSLDSDLTVPPPESQIAQRSTIVSLG